MLSHSGEVSVRSVWVRCLSWVWSFINGIARYALRRGWIKRVELPARVISVGNIQAGGAGKTPLVAQIAQEAHDYGLSVCILSRGYLSAWEKRGGVISPQDTNLDPKFCGDEPALLHELAPFAWIGVGSNRLKQYSEVVRSRGGVHPDLIILDDGFQNLKIKKDIEVVAITHHQPHEYVFRESFDALECADLLVWTKGDILPIDEEGLVHRPLCRVSYELRELFSDHSRSGKKSDQYWLITSIADSQSAYDLILQSGMSVMKHTALTDHFQYSVESVQSFLKQACDEQVQIILTGKDWVKWRSLGVKTSEVIVFEPRLKWVFGRKIWDRVLWEK